MWRVAAQVDRQGAALRVSYAVHGAMAQVRLTKRGTRPLWRHTCCELFVARPGSAAYQEFNFSPCGDWAGYAFSGYREGGAVEMADPGIRVRAGTDRLDLEGSVPVAAAGPLAIGLSAVIEETDGALSYWALRHPAGKPDFHHRDAFALQLE